MAQFPIFNDLPEELRVKIWDLAIRNDDPAVHFFTMYDVQKDPDSVVDPAKKVHAVREPETDDLPCESFRIGLAAPRVPGEGKLSWTDGNISTYLADSGLWTACKESRKRMLRLVRRYETSPPVSPCLTAGIWGKPPATANMAFTRDNGECQYLTVRPSTDLICLQIPENSKLSYSGEWFDWDAFNDFTWYDHKYGDGNDGHPSDIRNVAVEYDPSWEYSGTKQVSDRFASVSSAFLAVGEMDFLDVFWFIDYRLTRKYEPSRGEQGTRKFHAGNLTFIEVARGDTEWCRCPKEGCSDECFSNGRRHTKHGPHELVHGLRRVQEEDTSGLWWMRLGAMFRWGVLACVDLSLEGELPTSEEFYEMNAHRITDYGYESTSGQSTSGESTSDQSTSDQSILLF